MEYKTGLWEKQSEKGITYFNGKIKIGEQEYRITLFKNNKQKETQPDLNIIIRENAQKNENIVQKAEKTNIDEFENFGNMVNIDEELLD